VTRDDLLAFVRGHRLAVAATISHGGEPSAAVVGIAATDGFELVFDTLGSSHKAVNLRANGKIAIVIGWDDEQTLQIEGIADEPEGGELERLQRIYFGAFPDGPVRLAWPGITYFRVRPIVLRYSDFRSESPNLVTLRFD
jgi:hypothetical protein